MMDFDSRWILVVCIVLVCTCCLQVGAKPTENPAEDDKMSDVPIEDVFKSLSSAEPSLYFDGEKYFVRSEYDILYSLDEWKDRQSQHRQKRTAAIATTHAKRWTNKVVNYQFYGNHLDSLDKANVRLDMREWAHFTCVKFKENNAPNRMVIQNSKTCESTLGMNGGKQKFGLARACRKKDVILHELAHAMGMEHEHNRPDRDQYITINYGNIKSDARAKAQFRRRTWKSVMKLGIPYDYTSIVHYTSKMFSRNGRDTITTKDPKFQNKIGHYGDISFRDIKTINLMYDCHEETPKCTLKHTDCPGEGFVGKDCSCWCPGNPVKYCSFSDRLKKGDLARWININ